MPKKSPTSKYADVATGVRLSSHEKLCAERMENILKSIDEMKKEIKSLRQDVSMSKGGLKVIFYVGALITAIIGFLKLLKFS
jgi:archaellum component FlaC